MIYYLKRILNTKASSDHIKSEMVIKESDYVAMRRHLLRDDGRERACFLFCGMKRRGNVEDLYVHRVIDIEDRDYDVQNATYILPSINRTIGIFRDFERSGCPIMVFVHSHPFCENATFSNIDRLSLGKALRSIEDYLRAGESVEGFIFGAMVVGRDEKGFSGYLYRRDDNPHTEISSLKIVGQRGQRRFTSFNIRDAVPEILPDRELLDRNIMWLGEDGQRILSSSHLVICGLGGVGGLVALNVRGLGLRRITLVDDDTIERSNLNRLPGASIDDIGRLKVDVMARMIKEVSPHTEVVLIEGRVGDEQVEDALSEGDVIIAGLDSFSARFETQVIAARYLKPLIDIGSGINLDRKENRVKFMGGQVAFYIPGGACLCCQGVVPRDIGSGPGEKIRKAIGYVKDTDITPTSVTTINSILSGHAVDMFIRYITGFSVTPRYIRLDMLNNVYEQFNFVKKTDCPVCGQHGIEGKGKEMEQILPNRNRPTSEEVI